MRAGLAVGHSGVFALAIVTPCDRIEHLYFKFAALKAFFLRYSPIPAVFKVVGNDGRHFAYVHNYLGDFAAIVLLKGFLDFLYYMEYYSKFVHKDQLFFLTIIFTPRLIT